MDENGNGRNRITGHFEKGWKGGPGNPFSKRLHELRQSVIDCTTPEDVKAVIGKLFELAKSGDVQAARVWLEYVIGKPAQSLEISGRGGEPLGTDLARLTAVIETALAPWPEAKFALARSLRETSEGLGNGV